MVDNLSTKNTVSYSSELSTLRLLSRSLAEGKCGGLVRTGTGVKQEGLRGAWGAAIPRLSRFAFWVPVSRVLSPGPVS